MIAVECSCGAKINAEDRKAGMRVACPKCKAPLIVPGVAVEAPQVPRAVALSRRNIIAGVTVLIVAGVVVWFVTRPRTVVLQVKLPGMDEALSVPVAAVKKQKGPQYPRRIDDFLGDQWLRTPDWHTAVEYDELKAGDIFSGSAKTEYKLRLKGKVRLPKDIVYRSIVGRLKIEGDKPGIVLFEGPQTLDSDVSFTHFDFFWLDISPYDDANAKHRALRHDKELRATFTPQSAVLADGKTVTY